MKVPGEHKKLQALTFGELLPLDRCPHCGVAKPYMPRVYDRGEGTPDGTIWTVYECAACGGLVSVHAAFDSGEWRPIGLFPHGLPALSKSIPEEPREFLRQARESLGQPSGAVMLCASVVDSMLKDDKLTTGSLYERIDQAARDHLITQGMAQWAHQVRLAANAERHTDKRPSLPTKEDAERSLSFTMALAEVLYVIPDKVTRGIKESSQGKAAR